MKRQITNHRFQTDSKSRFSTVGLWRLSFIWVLVICLGNFNVALAQDISFTASVDKNQLAVGEQFELTFTLNGATGGKNFRAPSLNDFLTLSGPNSSTNMQFINGQMSSSVSYSYVLQPRSEGKFTIGQATIEAGGKQYQSQPITLVITKGTSKPKQQTRTNEEADIGQQIGDNLFLKAIVDKPKVYQGEQVTVTYKIYTRVNIANYNITKLPAYTGFWSEDLDVPKQIQLSNEVINGKQYRVGTVKKVALFPQRSGTLEVEPMELTCVVQVQTRSRSRDFFDQFFNDPFFGNTRNVNHPVGSDAVKLNVLPLPANAPLDFKGVVGKFSMEAWVDKRQTKTNEAVTLKIKITGRGNLKLIESPTIQFPSDIEHYDPKLSDNISSAGGVISGSRTFEYLLIPRHPGEQKIPSFPFSYFDTDKKSYATLTSPEFTLAVERGAEYVSGRSSGLSREDVKLLGEDIRFIKSGNISLYRKGERFIGTPVFYTLLVSPIVAFVGFITFVRRREKVMGDVLSLRTRKARKMALRRLSEAEKHLKQSKKEQFYTEISRALWGYVSDKLGIPPADLSTDTIRTSLESGGISSDSIQKLLRTIEQCDFARFAPATDSIQMENIYNQSIELISTIESELR
jgi:hypothetical protein